MAIEFYNKNENRRYPLSGDAANSPKLPDSFIIGMSITVPLGVKPWLNTVTLTPTLVSVSVCYSGSPGLVCTIPRPINPNEPYELVSLGGTMSGFVVLSDTINREDTTGSFIFKDESDGRLDPSVYTECEAPPVTGLTKLNYNVEPFNNIVLLKAGSGIHINKEGDTIVVALDHGVAPTILGPCDKDTEAGGCGRPLLRTINGVGPDSEGVITLEVV